MSFGYSVGDVLAVAQLAWNVYKICKDSPGVDKTVSGEVSSLHLVLKETEDLITEEVARDADAAARLKQISIGCKAVLDDLQGLLDKYNSLGTQAQRTWDRMRFGMEDITTIRSRLIAQTGMLTAFNGAVARSSQRRMEEKLDKFMAEVRAGLREGSVISTHTAHTVEQMDVDELWIGLHRELEDVGISPQLLNEKKDFIVAWFKTAIAEGTLEEMPSSDGENLQPPRLTISPPQREAFDPAQPPFTPSSRLSERQPGSISGAAPARLSPRTLSRSTSSGPLVRRRSSSRLSVRRLLGKILQDDKKFLAAAAAGKIATVAEQLKHGVDPDAKDETSLKTALHHATEHGHEDIVLLLLEYGANVNAIEKAGSSVLHIALEMGNVEIVKFLLDYGANVNTSQTDGSSLLHKAIETGHIEIFALLLQYGGNLNATQKYGFSLLHLAVETDQMEFIRLLLAYGAAKDAKNDNEVTALYLATEQYKKDALSLLLDGGCDTETTCVNGWTPLHCAAHLGYEGIVELLLNYGANMGAKGDDEATALHNAAKNGHEAVAIMLLDRGCDKEARDRQRRTPLHYAASTDNVSMIKLLLDRGAQKDAKDGDGSDGDTPLCLAAKKGAEKAVNVLLDSREDKTPNDNCFTALHKAAYSGYDTIVRLLIESGAAKEAIAEDKYGSRPLHLAAKQGHNAVVKVLLECGADIEARDKDGFTALIIAAHYGHEKVVKALLDGGAEKESKTNKGFTALHIAARFGHEKVVKVLLDDGAEKEAKHKDDYTALQIAAQFGREKVVKVLLDSGVEKEGITNFGDTALHIAARKGHERLVNLLLHSGAEKDGRGLEGLTALQWTARGAKEKAARALLDWKVEKDVFYPAEQIFLATARPADRQSDTPTTHQNTT